MKVTQHTPIDEQTSSYQSHLHQHRLSIKSLTTSFDRFPSWHNILSRKTSSASTFCGETINDLALCIEGCQIRTIHQHHQRRVFSLTQSRLNSLSTRSPINLTITHPSRENSDEFQPSALSLPNNTHSHSTNYLSITRLVPTSLAGSYDHLLTNQVNVPLSTSFHVTSQQSSTSKELSPDITITKTTSANFYYIPASDSLVFNNLVGTSLSALVPLHSANH
ncbi:unnamed protein product [Adineta ricciae]|uniref:Uncharacterized protein n=1 Tax=Adineta ricciae TaxID=249248 RepID=A0A813ZPX6_ADIRI|nr:unnamed protein product [Adineta ricciae]CAF1413710.1 unnamed protein product [Adineta ricciae]